MPYSRLSQAPPSVRSLHSLRKANKWAEIYDALKGKYGKSRAAAIARGRVNKMESLLEPRLSYLIEVGRLSRGEFAGFRKRLQKRDYRMYFRSHGMPSVSKSIRTGKKTPAGIDKQLWRIANKSAGLHARRHAAIVKVQAGNAPTTPYKSFLRGLNRKHPGIVATERPGVKGYLHHLDTSKTRLHFAKAALVGLGQQKAARRKEWHSLMTNSRNVPEHIKRGYVTKHLYPNIGKKRGLGYQIQSPEARWALRKHQAREMRRSFKFNTRKQRYARLRGSKVVLPIVHVRRLRKIMPDRTRSMRRGGPNLGISHAI